MINMIAEIGINHNGRISIAKQLIDVAKLSGFNYVKFQKRNPDVCVPEKQKSQRRVTPWGEMSYLDYRKKIEFSEKEYSEIDRYCNEIGIKWFASVWDLDSAKFMKQFNDIVKIPSPKLIDVELLKYCRENFSTRMLSTGMSDQTQVDIAIMVNKPDVIFHTNSCYPSKVDELNLKYITFLKNQNPLSDIGYSGHEWGLTTTYAAAALGVKWIERHVTLDHDMWGSDHKSSVDPVGMFKLVRGVRDIESALGILGPRVIGESELKKLEALR